MTKLTVTFRNSEEAPENETFCIQYTFFASPSDFLINLSKATGRAPEILGFGKHF